MQYGIDFWFREGRLARRRVTLHTLALEALLLVGLLLLQIPAIRSWVRPAARPIVRFGYEGPDRYVERIQLQTQDRDQLPMVDLGRVEQLPTRRGGGGGLHSSPRGNRTQVRRVSSSSGPGDDDVTRLAAARARMASVPLVQSSELVIESMEQPEYPEVLHQQGIEGRVAVMALIDTTGNVADVSVVSPSGHEQFEESALLAVKHSKFRPYRTEGTTQEVYALIRYRFRIY